MTDPRTIALISIAGSSLDVLGALYLAYDLLGGEHGPLRTLTRAVTYGALFGIGYGLPFGPVFGVATGVTHAVTLGWEFARAARQAPKASLWFDAAMSAIRGVGFAIGTSYLYGAWFGITFGVLITVGQVIAYRFGIRPGMDYSSGTRPRITKRQLLAAVNRTIGYGAAGYISALISHQRARALSLGLKVGLLVGLVTVISTSCAPFIEWMAERMPQRRMGVIGIGLILAGFSLQSVQYWVTLLSPQVR